MAPAVIAGLSNDARVNREEMFGPMTCLIKASSYEQALHLANDTEFGLNSWHHDKLSGTRQSFPPQCHNRCCDGQSANCWHRLSCAIWWQR